MNRIGDEASRILPDNQSDLIVSSTGRAWLVGPATGVEVTELTPGTTLRGVRIGTAWLRPIVGVEATELTDRHLAFDELFSARLARRLADALWAGRFDDELARLLWPRAEADGRVAYAVRALASSGAPAVGVLAESIGVSARHLRRLVERETGLPPKLIHQVARLRRTIDHAASGTHVDIAQLAVAAGYSDQAHFAREARRFSGLTPTALVGRR
ncbi:AraC family transcriptional regulator [Compostimonas suwonensis]|nr:helix-turn-helix domain-containing protein [Compostimonas suwonensis]